VGTHLFLELNGLGLEFRKLPVASVQMLETLLEEQVAETPWVRRRDLKKVWREHVGIVV